MHNDASATVKNRNLDVHIICYPPVGNTADIDPNESHGQPACARRLPSHRARSKCRSEDEQVSSENTPPERFAKVFVRIAAPGRLAAAG